MKVSTARQVRANACGRREKNELPARRLRQLPRGACSIAAHGTHALGSASSSTRCRLAKKASGGADSMRQRLEGLSVPHKSRHGWPGGRALCGGAAGGAGRHWGRQPRELEFRCAAAEQHCIALHCRCSSNARSCSTTP